MIADPPLHAGRTILIQQPIRGYEEVVAHHAADCDFGLAHPGLDRAVGVVVEGGVVAESCGEVGGGKNWRGGWRRVRWWV